MDKKDTKELKEAFNKIIDKVPYTKDQELLNELIAFNKTFKGQDTLFENLVENIKIILTSKLKNKMKIYVSDIIEDYNNSEKNQKKIEDFLKHLAEEYDVEKTFLDRIIKLLGLS